MYILVSQLCLALTGASFPENVFSDILFYLLQGQRGARATLGQKVKDFHKMTPFQLSLSGFPIEYYSQSEYDTLNKIKKILGYSMFHLGKWSERQGFANTFFTKTSAISGEKHYMKPVFISLKAWRGEGLKSPLRRHWWSNRRDLVSKLPANHHSLKIILYFKSLSDMKAVDSLFRQKGFNEKKKYTLKTLDISWMSKCVFCGDFMKQRSEKVRSSFTNPEELSRYCNNASYPLSGKTGYEWSSFITDVPICSCCRNSKERQGENRMNMLSRNGEDYATPPFHFKNSKEYHQSMARMYPKPDLSHIPKDIKLDWPTPLAYSLTYWDLTETGDHGSSYFWHPDLSADEYMRYKQYERNLSIESAGIEIDNRDSTDSWMDSG